MNQKLLFSLLVIFCSCTTGKKIQFPQRSTHITGEEFYRRAASMKWQQRDSFVVKEILSGNLPSFLKNFKAVHVDIVDSVTRKIITAVYYVAPDYLSIGTDDNWARVNITPMAAQRIADSFHCFLPTKKMVDDIYKSALVKFEPVPMFAFRDSTPTMWHHHLMIEGQRKSKKGLIAGIKKDVVISGKLKTNKTTDRVAIYGWHRLNGQPIQPLYTGHVNWWVDYSQGIRLVHRKIKVDGAWMDYADVLQHPLLKKLLCDEESCDFLKYPY